MKFLIKYVSVRSKEDEMGGTRGTFDVWEKSLQYFVGNREGMRTVEVVVVVRRIILKCVLWKYDGKLCPCIYVV